MMLRGTVGGILGGLSGAAAWVFATALSGTQLGLGLWLVGLLSGVGVALGMRREGTARAGFFAVLITLGALGAGTAAGSVWVTPENDHHALAGVTEADAISHLERTIQREWSEQGRINVLVETRDIAPEVRAEAMRQWATMPESEQAVTLARLAEQRTARKSGLIAGALGGLTLLDALWFLLALATAYKVAAYAVPSSRASRTTLNTPAPKTLNPVDDLSSASWGRRVPAHAPHQARTRKAA